MKTRITINIKRMSPRLGILLLTVFSLLLPTHLLNAESIDIHRFLTLVEKNNKDLNLARQELDIAGVNHREALSTALPKVQVKSDYRRNLKENFLYIDFPDFETGEMTNQKFKINYKNEFGLQLAVNQTVFSFKVGAALSAAKQYKSLTQHSYEAARNTIVRIAKKAFYQTLLAGKVRDIGKAAEENARDNYLQMKKKYEFGQISQFQLLQAEVRWQNCIPDTSRAQRDYELALNSLKNLAGIAPEEPLEIAGDFDHPPTPPETTITVDAALEKRPDFNALLWEEKLRATSIRNEKASLLPSLDLNLIYNFSAISDQFKLDRKNESYIINLSLTAPIFTGGYQGAQIQRARIELEKTRIRIAREKDAISTELNNIRLRMEEARNRMKAAETTLTAAEKAFEIAQVTADNGLATQLELKDARLACDQAKLNRYAACYDYLDAFFDWQYAAAESNPTAGSVQ